MVNEPADEAQALIVGSNVERGIVRNGKVVETERVTISDAYLDAVESAVIEQVFFARGEVSEYPKIAANSLTERLVRSGVINKTDAIRVRNMIEVEIKRGLDQVTEAARNRFATWLPLNLRSLIPLATTRRSRNQ